MTPKIEAGLFRIVIHANNLAALLALTLAEAGLLTPERAELLASQLEDLAQDVHDLNGIPDDFAASADHLRTLARSMRR